MTDYLNSDCSPLSIRLSSATKRRLERVAAEVGMSAPQYVEAMVATLLADAKRIKMESLADLVG